jgi:general secretion pathway protein L
MLGRCIGLDLGSHSIKVVELRQTLRGVELARLHAIPLPAEAPPAAEDDEAAAVLGAAPAAALREWARGTPLGGGRLVCAIPGDRVTRRHMHLPFRDRRRVGQAVPYEVESETPFDLEDVFVDWELVGSGRAGAEVVATVVPRAEVARRLAALRALGLAPRVLEVEGLVLANLATLLDLPGTRLVIDLGHRKTTLCLLVGGTPRAARTLPIGGLHLTRAIARERGIGLEQAEEIKCREGVLPTPGMLATGSPAAMRVLDLLLRDLARSFGSFEVQLGAPAEKAIEAITLIGGGARLARIEQILAERTGIPTARLAVPPGPATGALLAAGDPLRFAPALALALRGSFQTRTRTNFLQGEFAPRLDLRGLGRQLRGTGLLAAAALVLALAVGASRIGLESRRARVLEAELARIWSEAQPGRPVPADVPRALEQSLREARQRADLLGIYGGSLSALDLLAEISRLVPADLTLVFEELSIDGQVVRVRGHTSSYAAVDQLRGALATFPSFADIRVSEIQADSTRGGNNFNVTISLVRPETTP